MLAYSSSARRMRSSEIRKLMKLAADPSIISFAGGMPNNSLFPVEAVDELWASLPRAQKEVAFQYGPTPGYPPLVEALKGYLASRKIPLEGNDLIITTGAQQAINLVTKVLVDPGDTIVTEYPSFIGAVAAFLSYGARLRGVAMDQDGIVLDKLERMLARCRGRTLKMVYLNPCFQNPGGTIYSNERKAAVLEVLAGRKLCLLEDDPYSELYFDPADLPLTVPMKAMPAAREVPVAYAGSFAKIFGPGMRLGWLLAPAELAEKVELAKQSMDACSATFTQVLAHAYLTQGKLPGYLAMVRTAYKRRAATMLAALEEHMPEGVTWTHPRGGFYIWVTLPPKMDSTAVFNASLAKGAAFVIGSAFDPEGKRNNCFRLAFSHTPEERIAEGTRIVCEAVKGCIKR